MSDNQAIPQDTDPDPMILGQVPLSRFLSEYWQKKPCLFRQALPGFSSPLDMDEVAGLAMEDDIESRLVIERPDGENPWELRNGPFSEAELTQLPDSHWTLLVQAVDQWIPEVQSFLDHFSALPRWRLDDIMISLAPEGGSVGPHFDQYDVFLVQAEGRRRWQVGPDADSDTPLAEGTPLKILRNMAVTDEWDLEPGDVLYLPPRLTHHGVALSQSMTWSVGFRAPDAVEALQGLALRGDLEADADFLRYTDGDMQPEESLAQTITPQALARLRHLIKSLSDRDDVMADWLGAYMTQNKYELFDWTESDESPVELPANTLINRALPTRITAFGNRLYINGRAFVLPPDDTPLIDTLLTNDHWSWGQLTGLALSDTAQRMLDILIHSGSLEPGEG